MFITKLELCGYRRFKLNQIKRFKITPHENIQLILGTNGSGKSSLMEELTPLPAIAGNYAKDGYKIIEYSHNGHHYVLTSDFSLSQAHSFKKNGEELNDGGTITVQKKLVYQEFGINNEIHELMIGQEKFHLMSPARRREWFTELGEADYDYSLKVFGRLKETFSTTQGALKLAKKRIVVETAKLISPEKEAEYRAEVAEIHRVLTILIEQKDPSVPARYETEFNFAEVEKEIKLITDLISRMKIHKPSGCEASSITDLEFDIWDIENQIKRLEGEIQTAVQQHDELEKFYSLMEKAGQDGIRDLDKKKAPIEAEKLKIRKQQKLGLIFTDPETILSVLDTIEPVLTDLLSELPINQNRQYSRMAIEKEQKLQSELNESKLRLERDYNRLVTHRSHMDLHLKEGATECPKCKHKWVKNYSEETYKQTQAAIEQLEVKIADVVKQVRDSEERLVAIADYQRKYREFIRMVESSRSLSSFWELIENQNLIIDNPRNILIQLSLLREDLHLEAKFRALLKEESEINELASVIQKTEANNLEDLQKRLNFSTTSLAQKTASINLLREMLGQRKSFLQIVKQAGVYEQQLKNLITKAQGMHRDEFVAWRNEMLTFCIREFQSTLAQKEKILSESEVQKGLVNDLNDQINKLEIDQEALKVLLRNLSPTDGLIAEGLFGFIKSFVRQMNIFIKKTWSYPLEIIPCGMNEDGGVELDYKFPLMIQSQDNVVPDISKGSTGMKEVVDLAFKLMSMKRLGLEDGIIMLDEFGNALDHAHRISAIGVIKSIMEQQAFSQLFMISHYDVSYGALTNAEICVLDPNNIVVPSDYNKHVEME